MIETSYQDSADHGSAVVSGPSARLRSRISGYTFYQETIGSFLSRREPASTAGVLLFALGDALTVTSANGTTLRVREGQAFVGGIADATSISRGSGRQKGIHVRMPLHSLAVLTRMPLAELSNSVVPLADVLGRASLDLGEALCEAEATEARFKLLDEFLERRFAEAGEAPAGLAWAFRRLSSAHSAMSSAIALDLGWSRRHFARRFRQETGFGPDRFRRIARFERFIDSLAKEPASTMASLAAEVGYTDEAHLARDVREFSNMTPGGIRTRLNLLAGGIRDS